MSYHTISSTSSDSKPGCLYQGTLTSRTSTGLEELKAERKRLMEKETALQSTVDQRSNEIKNLEIEIRKANGINPKLTVGGLTEMLAKVEISPQQFDKLDARVGGLIDQWIEFKKRNRVAFYAKHSEVMRGLKLTFGCDIEERKKLGLYEDEETMEGDGTTMEDGERTMEEVHEAQKKKLEDDAKK